MADRTFTVYVCPDPECGILHPGEWLCYGPGHDVAWKFELPRAIPVEMVPAERAEEAERRLRQLEDRYEFCDNCERPARDGDLEIIWCQEAESGEQVDARICLVCRQEQTLKAVGEKLSTLRVVANEHYYGGEPERIQQVNDAIDDTAASLDSSEQSTDSGTAVAA